MKKIQCALFTMAAVAGTAVAGEVARQSLGPVRDANGVLREGLMFLEDDGSLAAVGLADSLAASKSEAGIAAVDYGYFAEGLDEQIFFDGFEPPCSGVTSTDVVRLISAYVEGLGGGINVTQFSSLYGAFPGINTIRRVRVPQDTYYALEFVPTGNPNQLGKFSFIASNSVAPASLTISECPGDFRPTAEFPQPGCALDAAQGGEGAVTFIIDTTFPASTRCQLKSGKTYYLNVINAKLGSADVSICPNDVNNCTPSVKNAPGQ